MPETIPEPTLVARACENCKFSTQSILNSRTCTRCISYSNKPGYKTATRSVTSADKDSLMGKYEEKKGDVGELLTWLDDLRINSLRSLAAEVGVKKVIGYGKYDLIEMIMEKTND